MTTTTQPSAAPCPDDASRLVAGQARAALAEDLAVLARFRDLAAAMAEALVAEVQARAQPPAGADADAEADAPEAPPPPVLRPVEGPVFTGDPGLTFSRLSRAVRMTCNLRARLLDEAERLDDLQRRRADTRAAEARAERKARIARLLTRIIEDEAEAEAAAGDDAEDAIEADAAELGDSEGEGAEGRETEGEIDVDRLVAEASECLRDRERFGDVLDRPVSAFIDHVCRDLGLSPDWQRLAREAWAQEEMASGEVGEPLLNLQNSAHPREGGDPGFLKRSLPRRATVRPAPPPEPETKNTWAPAFAGVSGDVEGPEPEPPPPAPPPEPPPPRALTPREQRELEDDIAYAHALPGELPPRRRISPPAAPP